MLSLCFLIGVIVVIAFVGNCIWLLSKLFSTGPTKQAVGRAANDGVVRENDHRARTGPRPAMKGTKPNAKPTDFIEPSDCPSWWIRTRASSEC
jgi:hypothetical protein